MKVVNKENAEKYTEFLSNHERCNFGQSIEWGRVKEAWKKHMKIR